MKWLDAWDRQLTRLNEDRFYFLFLGAMTTVVAAVMIEFALGMQRNFLTIACDTAGVQNAIVNTLHGIWFRDTAYGGPNALGGHTTFVLLLLAPIYAIFPSVDTLLILQVAGVYSTVIPLYLVGREILGRPLSAFLVACVALASPMLFQMALAPVHPETWISAAVFWSYYFYRTNRLKGFWVSFAFAVSCGEMAALIYIAMGLALLLTEDGIAWRKKYGQFALVGGLGWLLGAVLVLFPLMHVPGQNNVFAYNYTQWGVATPGQLLSAVAHDPLLAIGFTISPIRWLYVVGLVGLPVLLAFLSWRSFLLLAPLPVYFLMCHQEFYLYIHAYYFQFAFFAGYMGFLFFLARLNSGARLGAVMLASSAFINVILVCTAAGYFQQLGLAKDATFNGELHAAFKTIPADAGVYSPHRFSAYLSNRENMVLGDLYEDDFDFNKMLNATSGITDVRPEQIDYIVSDFENDQCGFRGGAYNEAKTKKREAFIDYLLKSGEWEMFWNKNSVVILKRVEK
jgi:uncharacterized membrane protein